MLRCLFLRVHHTMLELVSKIIIIQVVREIGNSRRYIWCQFGSDEILRGHGELGTMRRPVTRYEVHGCWGLLESAPHPPHPRQNRSCPSIPVVIETNDPSLSTFLFLPRTYSRLPSIIINNPAGNFDPSPSVPLYS